MADDAPKKKMPTVPWLPMRLDLADDPVVLALAARCEDVVDEDHAVGKLHKLWSWANKQTTDGNARSVTFAWIERYICALGFAQVLLDEGWLEELEGGGYRIPKFDRWNSKSAKTRLQTARRVAEHRKGNAGGNGADVTDETPGVLHPGAQQRYLEVEVEKEEEKEKDGDEKKNLQKVVSSDETRRDDQKNLSTDAQRGEQEIWAAADALAVRTIAKLKLTPKRPDRELMLKCARLVINDQLPEHWLLDATEAYDKRTTPKRKPWGFVTRCLQNKAVEDYGEDLNTLLATIKVPGWLLGPPENTQTKTSRQDAGTQRKETIG